MVLLRPRHGHERDRAGDVEPGALEAVVRTRLEGNFCRRTWHQKIVKPVPTVAAVTQKG
jgi:aerobic-type carbon monoxide dehydrogenase small subunit (CoxS/CutS family)